MNARRIPGLPRPQPGDLAPEAQLLDLNERDTLLSRFWAARPAVVVFLRYFGCPFCQMQVVSLREERDRFEQAGAGIVLIGQGSAQEGRSFIEARRLPFPCLIDVDHMAFRSYGLGRGSLGQILGPKVALPFARAHLHRETFQRGLKGGSFMQMPGTFVVDSSGIIRLAHRNRTVADNPRNDLILSLLRDLHDPRAEEHQAAAPRWPDTTRPGDRTGSAGRA